MRVLVLGSSSFAAQGLVEVLLNENHEVFTLDRGRRGESRGTRLKAPIAGYLDASSALGHMDVIVNFTLLKGESVDANLSYLSIVSQMGGALGLQKLIHVSSLSVVDQCSRRVDESTPLENHVKHKGEYSRVKIETERWLREHWKQGVLEILRPGFILAPGLIDPIVGIGKTLPLGRLLCLGSASGIVPIIHRDTVHIAISRLIIQEGKSCLGSSLLVAPNSPTRHDYLLFASEALGMAQSVWVLPRWCWILLLLAGSGAMSVVRRRWTHLLARMGHMLEARTYDGSDTGRRLGLDLRCDWQRTLLEGRCGSRRNYAAVSKSIASNVHQRSDEKDHETCLLYVGCGRIVRERHFPALRQLGYSGLVEWWDPYLAEEPSADGLRLHRLTSLTESRAKRVVIATPSFARAENLVHLPQSARRILMEKPLATRMQECEDILLSIPSEADAYVLHNYRFKENVAQLTGFLARVNSGRLLQVRLRFDSPPVALDGATWMRDERRSRTLLSDYAIHFLDLALLFGEGEPSISGLRSEQNQRGETSRIDGVLRCDNHTVDFCLRQGGNERRCELEYLFENYTCVLRFFPDTFEASLGRRTFLDALHTAGSEMHSVAKKLTEKIGWSEGDQSHRRVLGSFLGLSSEIDLESLRLDRLMKLYSCIFAVGDSVYGVSPVDLSAPRNPTTCAPASHH